MTDRVKRWEIDFGPVDCCGPYEGVIIQDGDQLRLVWCEAGCGGPAGWVYEAILDPSQVRWVDGVPELLDLPAFPRRTVLYDGRGWLQEFRRIVALL